MSIVGMVSHYTQREARRFDGGAGVMPSPGAEPEGGDPFDHTRGVILIDERPRELEDGFVFHQNRTGPDPAPPPQTPPQMPPTSTTAGQAEGGARQLQAALSVLAEYIPSEVVAIYIFGLSTISGLSKLSPDRPWWTGLMALCVLLCVFFVTVGWLAGRKQVADLRFPRWPLFAALSSFAIWSVAIPGNPLVQDPAVHLLAGFAALVSSFVLKGVEMALPD